MEAPRLNRSLWLAEAEPGYPALEGEANPGEGVDEVLLGTVERTDGTQQTTYNELPLYYFSGDQSAGDVNGQGLGEVCWMMGASGTPVAEHPTMLSLTTTIGRHD